MHDHGHQPFLWVVCQKKKVFGRKETRLQTTSSALYSKRSTLTRLVEKSSFDLERDLIGPCSLCLMVKVSQWLALAVWCFSARDLFLFFKCLKESSCLASHSPHVDSGHGWWIIQGCLGIKFLCGYKCLNSFGCSAIKCYKYTVIAAVRDGEKTMFIIWSSNTNKFQFSSPAGIMSPVTVGCSPHDTVWIEFKPLPELSKLILFWHQVLCEIFKKQFDHAL